MSPLMFHFHSEIKLEWKMYGHKYLLVLTFAPFTLYPAGKKSVARTSAHMS